MGMGDTVGKLFRWKHKVHIDIEDEAKNKFDLQILGTLKIYKFYQQF